MTYGRLSLSSAPSVEPITATEAKLHLKVDVSTDDDLITSLIVAARQYVEAFTNRRLVTQTWTYKLDGFPCEDVLWLPTPPVSSVTGVQYVDANGDTQTFSTSDYATDLPSGPNAGKGRIYLAYGSSWPTTQDIPNAVTVTFVCGYAAAGATDSVKRAAVPDGIKAAMKLLIGHWYANREAVVIGQSPSSVPQAVDAILWSFKAF